MLSQSKTKEFQMKSSSRFREAVLTGKFQIGDRLPTSEPCRTIAASRTSVREALRGLEQQGVIYTKKGVTGGAFRR